jgi:hypothetical protein
VRHRLASPLIALGAVFATTAVLRAAGAHLTVAALVSLFVVVVSALGGFESLAVAAVAAYLSL